VPFLTLRFARSVFTGVWRAEGLTIFFLAEVLAEMSLFVFPPVLLRAVCLVLAILHRMYHPVADSTYYSAQHHKRAAQGQHLLSNITVKLTLL